MITGLTSTRTARWCTAAALAGCACAPGGDGPGARVAIDTMDSVVIVRNGERGQWSQDEVWEVHEQFRFGTAGLEDEGHAAFTNELIATTLGPDGVIYVLDWVGQELIRIEDAGARATPVARPGPGPGELQSTAGIGWDPQRRLWTADTRGRYTIFDSAGQFVTTVPRPVHGWLRRAFPLVFDSSGRFVDEGFGRGNVIFLRIDPATQSVDTLTSLPLSPKPLPNMPILPGQDEFRYVLNHYLTETVWAVGTIGTLWAATTDRLRLYEIDLETGDTLRIVDTVHRDDLSLSDRDQERIRMGMAEAGVDPSAFDLARPVLQSLHVTDDGFVLVQIVDDVDEYGNMFDVFDPEGIFLGTMTLPFRLPSLSSPDIVGDTLIGVALGAYDEPYIVRSTIVRPRSSSE